jgi:hypothetical protein
MRLEGRILRRCRVIVSGLPRTAILRYRRRPSSKLPWNLDLPAPADEARRVSSVRFTLRLRQRESPGHPESSLASGSLDRPDPTSPWSFGLSKVPMNRIPVRPETLFFGCAVLASSSLPDSTWSAGSMMNPGCPRTLHPRFAPWMNLRVQSGFAASA